MVRILTPKNFAPKVSFLSSRVMPALLSFFQM